MNDVLGNELQSGDNIVYVVRRGSSMDMTPAKVIESVGSKVRVQPSGVDWRGRTRKPVLLATPGYVVRVGLAQ